MTGDQVGAIDVSWQYPRIPWHGVPCSGVITAPGDCPAPLGGVIASSNGGMPITEYEVSYNENEDFSGYDTNKFVTANLKYTIAGLTPGRKYFIRVLARNSQGSGKFCNAMDRNCLTQLNTQVVTATSKALVA